MSVMNFWGEGGGTCKDWGGGRGLPVKDWGGGNMPWDDI